MRILIAEDDMISRRVLERILTKWGYEVVSTRDGAEAWEILKSGDYERRPRTVSRSGDGRLYFQAGKSKETARSNGQMESIKG